MFRLARANRVGALSALFIATLTANEASAQPATWMPAGDLPTNHLLGALAPLPSGRWLIVGGYTTENGPVEWQEASSIRTSTGGWIRGPSLPDTQGHRQRNHLVILDDGDLLFAGEPEHLGAHPHDRTAHRFTETSSVWREAGVTVRERYGGKLVKLSDGDALFIGGYNGHSGGEAIASTERYDPIQNEWTFTASMAAGRGGLDAVVLTAGPDTGDVLVCGGFEISGAGNFLNSCELYDPTNEAFTPGPPLNTRRTGGTAIGLSDGRVVFIGGRSAQGQATASTEIYDPVTRAWTETASMATARGEVVAALLPDGDIIVTGGWGNNTTEVLDTVERFDTSTERWSSLPTLPEPRARHVMAVLDNGDILVAGGVDEENNPLRSALILVAQAATPVDAGVIDSGVDAGTEAPDAGSTPDSGPTAPDAGSTEDPTNDDNNDDSGCSCRQDSAGMASGWWALLGLLWFFVRRRPMK